LARLDPLAYRPLSSDKGRSEVKGSPIRPRFSQTHTISLHPSSSSISNIRSSLYHNDLIRLLLLTLPDLRRISPSNILLQQPLLQTSNELSSAHRRHLKHSSSTDKGYHPPARQLSRLLPKLKRAAEGYFQNLLPSYNCGSSFGRSYSSVPSQLP
jgi:hypothetical protein